MAELRNLKKYELFLSLKRDLALVCTPHTFFICRYTPSDVCLEAWLLAPPPPSLSFEKKKKKVTQAAHVTKEWVDQTLYKKKEKESKHYATLKTHAQTDKKLKETLLKQNECDKARKSAKAWTLKGMP